MLEASELLGILGLTVDPIGVSQELAAQSNVVCNLADENLADDSFFLELGLVSEGLANGLLKKLDFLVMQPHLLQNVFIHFYLF